jgi:ABC-type dipeptide/oligopeptide/nickel transport system permease component
LAGVVARRLLAALPTLIGVSVLVFLMVHLIPGDPARLVAGADARAEDIENVRRALGLDRPLWEQFLAFVGRVLRGDLGNSFRSGLPVAEEVAGRWWATAQLSLAAILVAVVVGGITGIASAVWRGGWIDSLALLFSLTGVSMPTFFLGLLLMLVFSVQLGLLPLTGMDTPAHFILPAITLGLPSAAVISRVMRSSLLEVLGQDYVRTARAKGLAETLVIRRHALRNALIPVVTVIGLQLGYLLGGAVVTETVFAWPGIGRLIIQAISARDFPLLQGAILVLAVSFVLVNLLADLLYTLLDPRIGAR